MRLKSLKDLLFNMCSDAPRNIRHQGDMMNENNIKDILKLPQLKKSDVPETIAVKDLNLLNPVTFNNANVSIFLIGSQ